MKKAWGLVGAALVIAGPAFAADLAGKAPVYKAPPPAPVFSWTGWYIGGNVGYGFGRGTSPALFADGAPSESIFPNLDPKGVIGGGQIGYDWQFNPNWVIGVVADFQGADVEASGANSLFANNSLGTEALSEKLQSFRRPRVTACAGRSCTPSHRAVRGRRFRASRSIECLRDGGAGPEVHDCGE